MLELSAVVLISDPRMTQFPRIQNVTLLYCPKAKPESGPDLFGQHRPKSRPKQRNQQYSQKGSRNNLHSRKPYENKTFALAESLSPGQAGPSCQLHAHISCGPDELDRGHLLRPYCAAERLAHRLASHSIQSMVQHL